ncbi:hypothetical protein [Alkalicoccus chagannorensis]|uniref:hypothetical protein n=1 Tax=Alkalicoccus chagannorensis TaxID=427072 RepID=UPI000424BB90|nr:hypothetical protein [Alkalicoccus chagannorensis]
MTYWKHTLWIALSLFSLQNCGEPDEFGQAELTVDPVFTGNTLVVTPLVTHVGEDDFAVRYEGGIATIVSITDAEGETVYTEEEEQDSDQETVMQEGDQLEGMSVEVADAEPGQYTIEAEASFHVVTRSGDQELLQPYEHSLTQQIEVQAGG